MSDDETSSESAVAESLPGALVRVIERLREPPLLFALGVLILLAIVTAVSVEGFALFWIPALALAVTALAAWLIPLLSGRRGRRAETRVRLRAKDVGEKGVVKGIEGMPTDRLVDVEVDVKAKKIRGRTVGISAHDPDEKNPNSD